MEILAVWPNPLELSRRPEEVWMCVDGVEVEDIGVQGPQGAEQGRWPCVWLFNQGDSTATCPTLSLSQGI